MSRTEDTQRGRRQYADLVQQRNSIQRDIDRQNGTLEPTTAKIKRGFISFLVGWFAMDFIRGFTRDN